MAVERKRLSVDLNVCIKAGECYYNHPRLFKRDAQYAPHVLVEYPETPEDIFGAQSAADVCPARAIKYA